jgi:hypothetical protein
LTMVDDQSGAGDRVEVAAPLAPPAVELIEVRKK